LADLNEHSSCQLLPPIRSLVVNLFNLLLPLLVSRPANTDSLQFYQSAGTAPDFCQPNEFTKSAPVCSKLLSSIQYNTIVTWCTLKYKIKSSSSVLQSQ